MQNKYKELIEDCQGILTEGGFVARMSRVEVYHTLGGRIIEDTFYKEFEKGNTKFLADLAKNIGTSTRTIYYAVKFYQLFPDLALLKEGKDLSWSKIVEKYLTKSKEKVTRTLFCEVCQRSFEHDCKNDDQHLVVVKGGI